MSDSPETVSSVPLRELRKAMNELAKRIEATGVHMGVAVEDLSGKTLYAHRGTTPFVLASNTKLFTTAAALLSLPPDFRWQTTARLDGDTLWIIGGGDATFHIINGFSYPDHFLDEVANALKAAKKTSLKEVVVDGRYFDEEFQSPNWPSDQLRRRYAAPVSGLPYARGLVRIKQEGTSVYVATTSPLGTASSFIRNGLRRRGITLKETRIAGVNENAPDDSRTIYTQPSSLTLYDIIRETNRESDNYLAEHLLKTLGAETLQDGSFDGGSRAVRHALAMIDVSLTGYEQIDGSGLARKASGGNVAAPETITTLLRRLAQTPQGEVFVSSLAVGGVTGTLKNRYSKSSLQGHVFAKTGYIAGCVALSGYLVGAGDRYLTFSILANYTGDTFERRAAIRDIQERMLTAMMTYTQSVEDEWERPEALVRAFSAE
ncbi:MAG: D-alanyl-D-alanine carboxypeptidase [Candidatus Poribacteria bacterium]|nr:D-alanyl-D-alanine carboxypeptidase [Candidatus Poribacteria bacterium]